MRILVTGSSGFIGTTLVRRLCAIGEEVGGLDRYPPREDVGAKHYEADLLDSPAITRAIHDFRPEIFVHLAARTSLKEVPPESDRYHANTIGTQNMINAAAGVDVRRVIFTSTKYVCRGNDVPAHREYRPTTSYGQSKAEMEELVWTEGSKIPEWCITRPTTVWGPGMGKHYQKFLSLVLNGGYFHIGSKPVHKHMAYVENISWQFECLISKPAADVHQGIFYLADYEPMILREWAEYLRTALGGPRIPTVPYPLAKCMAFVCDRIAETVFRKFPFTSFRLDNLTLDDVCNISATQRVCGPLPFTTKQGAEATADWFRKLLDQDKN